MVFLLLQQLTVLKIKPEAEEACPAESSSSEQQGRASVASGVKEEAGETERAARQAVCAVSLCVVLSLAGSCDDVGEASGAEHEEAGSEHPTARGSKEEDGGEAMCVKLSSLIWM